MPRPVVWILSTDELVARVDRLGEAPLAVDTESDSLHRYPERVCLIQISIADADLLIDPLADVAVERLAGVLERERPRKVLHGADYDLRVLDRDFGLRLRGLFDTMIAARLIGERAFGLAALLERFLDVRTDKRFQRADWSRRPLPAAMEAYAVRDTRYLLSLADALETRLAELGRVAWAQEEFRRLEQVRWSPPSPADAFRRIKGSGALDTRGLAVLRELVAFRDRAARARNRPPFTVLTNEVLLRLSRQRPAASGSDRRLPAFVPRGLRADETAGLHDALQRGWSAPEQALPDVRVRSRPERSTRWERALRALMKRRDRVARELDLDPSVVAARSVLEAVLERLERGESPAAVEELRRWQGEVLAEAFAAVEL